MVSFFRFSPLVKFLILLFSYMCIFGAHFWNMILELKTKQSQVQECHNWCNKDGMLITFNTQEKAHCISKCNSFSITPPILNYGCKMVCKPFDLFLGKICSKSEFCSYYREVNALTLKDGVESRWHKALKNKVFGSR